MSRSKVRKYEFGIPVTNINKTGGLFSVTQAGQLWVTARALIDFDLEVLPEDQTDKVRITLEAVRWQEVDILPLINQPEWKSILAWIMKGAYNNLTSILSNQ
jgi:hypothetical protein